jgi:hypothetical protein
MLKRDWTTYYVAELGIRVKMTVKVDMNFSFILAHGVQYVWGYPD